MKRLLALALLLCFLTGCGAEDRDRGPSSDCTPTQEPQAEETHLLLDGRRYTYDGDADDLTVENDRLILRRAGVYRLSGELKEGRIRVETGAEATVRLILDGVSISSSFGSPLELCGAACVTLEMARGSVNFLSGGGVIGDGEALPAACIRSEGTLVLCGDGFLTVKGERSDGIAAMGRVIVSGGSATVAAERNGVWTRDGLYLNAGSLTVSTAECGVAAPSETTGKVMLSGGRLTANCTKVGILAGREIAVGSCEVSVLAPTRYQAPSPCEISG